MKFNDIYIGDNLELTLTDDEGFRYLRTRCVVEEIVDFATIVVSTHDEDGEQTYTVTPDDLRAIDDDDDFEPRDDTPYVLEDDQEYDRNSEIGSDDY
jgi:hypothetical protein